MRDRCSPQPGGLLKTRIPIRTGPGDVPRPGYLESDSVAHCGASLAGDFIWRLTCTDLASQWTEGRAVWNKGAAGVLAATRAVEAALPFARLGFACDNGREFLNHHLLHYLHERRKPVAFTRSRPYHSDDNAHVEQKNWMWPRQRLGYARLERAELGAPISALYAQVWGPLRNFLLPGLKLKEKWREKRQWKKRYELAGTPTSDCGKQACWTGRSGGNCATATRAWTRARCGGADAAAPTDPRRRGAGPSARLTRHRIGPLLTPSRPPIYENQRRHLQPAPIQP